MHISEVGFRNEAGVVRAEARIAWEEAEQPPFRLFVETDERFHEAFWVDPNAFLISCAVPAWQAGERRIKVEDRLCPVLCQNVRAALHVLDSWYPGMGTGPRIEAGHGFKVLSAFKQQALCLLSCGIDSLATLRWNRLHVPSDHAASIKAVLVVAFDDQPCSGSSRNEFSSAIQPRFSAAEEIAKDANVAPIPVRTNVWWLVDDGYFYSDRWHGAVLSSLADFFSRGFSRAYIASSYVPANLHPWGSHPLLDPYYSSAHFQIDHHGLQMSRLEKTALVADWDAGLQNTRVCQNDNSGGANCGTCEKCIRTMTTLLTLGKLAQCRAFPADDVSVDLLETLEKYQMIRDKYQAAWYRELTPMLRKRGREDLATAIEGVLARCVPTSCCS